MDEDIKALVNAAFADAMQGFEQRLASSMQKALDIVTAQQEQRIQALEEDVARLLQHTGLN
jgi:hypothetical protein